MTVFFCPSAPCSPCMFGRFRGTFFLQAKLCYITDTLIPSRHFSIQLHQNIHPEDGIRWSLRNVGTINGKNSKQTPNVIKKCFENLTTY